MKRIMIATVTLGEREVMVEQLGRVSKTTGAEEPNISRMHRGSVPREERTLSPAILKTPTFPTLLITKPTTKRLEAHDMKITKRQLRRIIQEERDRLVEGPVTKPGAKWEDRVMLRNVDTATPYATRVTVAYDMVTIEFGNSFTISLDSLDAQSLADSIKEAALQLEDIEAGRNPGGSIG